MDFASLSLDGANLRPQIAYQSRITTAAALTSGAGLLAHNDKINPRAIGGQFAESEDPRCADFSQLGVFAGQRGLVATAELLRRDVGQMFFTGGVCALSTRESTLARLGHLEVNGNSFNARDLPQESAVQVLRAMGTEVSVAQIFETIGLTPRPGAVVLENTLWAMRVSALLGIKSPSISEAVEFMVKQRNESTFIAVERLRADLFGPTCTAPHP